MENLRDLETNVLMEMLVKHTAELTAKIAARDARGSDQYEYELALIQAEINFRMQAKDNTTVSENNIEFTSTMHPAAAAPDAGTESVS